jgi:beta-galactosidase
VDEQYVPYIMPQENGNKCDVRWAALTDRNGVGLLAVGMPLLNVSALHYTSDDLTRAKHTNELKRRDDITFNLDYAMLGLGGDDSWTPMTVHPPYRVMPQPYRFRLRLRLIDCKESGPESVSKLSVPVVQN